MALVMSTSGALLIADNRMDSIKFAEFACFAGLIAYPF